MNYRVALDLLGLDGDDTLTSDRVRRSYMRKLRLHPPERDPDGFRRLREAYELVLQFADDGDADDQAASAAAQAERAAQVRAFVSEGTLQASPGVEPAVVPLADVRGEVPLEADRPPVRQPLVMPVELAKPPAAVPVAPMKPLVPVELAKPPVAVPVELAKPPVAVPVELAKPRASVPIELEKPPLAEPVKLAKPPVPVEAAKPERPRFVVQQLPVARVVKAQLPEPLSVMVPRLLELLEAGDIEAALKVHGAWRSSIDADDVRQSNAQVAARWTLVRELLDVARRVSPEIVRIVARAISDDDVASARPALEAFRAANPTAAGRANTVLAAGAPTLFAPLQHTLFAPHLRPDPPSASFEVPQQRSGGGGRLWLSIPVLLIALVRLCASSSSTPSFQSYGNPSYTLTQDQIDGLTRVRRPVDLSPLTDLANLPPSPPALTSQTTADAERELRAELEVLSQGEIGSYQQSTAANALGFAATRHSCPDLRVALKALEAAPRPAAEDSAVRADQYISAIHLRVERICAAKPEAPSKPTKPRATKPRPAASAPTPAEAQAETSK
jgi:hypothetical protein